VISIPHVKLGEVLSLAESVQKFADEGEWVAIFGRDIV
jgi:hypothetical protein